MGLLILFLSPFISLAIIAIITRPLVRWANKKRLEREAREEVYKMKLIEKMLNEESNNV